MPNDNQTNHDPLETPSGVPIPYHLEIMFHSIIDYEYAALQAESIPPTYQYPYLLGVFTGITNIFILNGYSRRDPVILQVEQRIQDLIPRSPTE